MSKKTKAVDREETFDKLVAVRVRSELVERIETLSEETISEELRNGLRARRLELEEEHNQLVTDGGNDVSVFEGVVVSDSGPVVLDNASSRIAVAVDVDVSIGDALRVEFERELSTEITRIDYDPISVETVAPEESGIYVWDHSVERVIASGFDSLDAARSWIDARDREEISRTSEPDNRTALEPVDGREL